MANFDNAADVEVIFESWLYKLRGDAKSHTFSFSTVWHKKYFVLVRDSNKPRLFYYNKKPSASYQVPKGVVELSDCYRIEKIESVKGKELVCQLTTADRVIFLAAEKEHIHHLLMFFLRTQTRLKETLESECFVVRPENSEDHRKIGSRGAMCLLHVSQWGITLALQLSKCILAQWPLRCVRSYECSGRGRFALDIGSHAATGPGCFVFNTRIGQDTALYDRIDTLVNELTALQGLVSARVSNVSLANMESLSLEYQGLSDLTVVQSDSFCISQLKRISRDIYDHLAEHLGSASGHIHGALAQSTADVASIPANTSRSESRPIQHIPLASFHSSSSSTENNQNVILSSQYLHMHGTDDDNERVSASPVFSCSLSTPTSVHETNRLYSLERPTDSFIETQFSEPGVNGETLYVNTQVQEQVSANQCLATVDEPSEYMGMLTQNTGGPAHDYANDTAVKCTAPGVYSYACTPDFTRMNSQLLDAASGGIQTFASDGTASQPPADVDSVNSLDQLVHVEMPENGTDVDKGRPPQQMDSTVRPVHMAPGISATKRTRVFTRQKSGASSDC